MGTLSTEMGDQLPELVLTPGHVIDKTSVIYGPTGTGKTVIVKHIMKTVRPHIDQAIIVAPSEPSNRSYTGFVDAPLIHYRLWMPDPAKPKKDDGAAGAMRFLMAIWKRQEMMAAIYTRANDPKTLAQLYARLPRAARREGDRNLGALDRVRRTIFASVREEYSDDAGMCEEKIKKLDEKFTQMLVLVYKKFIAPFAGTLFSSKGLSENERYSLYYLHFNPRLLLIFDDCAAQLKPFFNKEIFRLLFYQNRHSFITVVVCCQDDTDLPTNLRKNAYISMFMEPIVCSSNFERGSNKFPKSTRELVGRLIPVAYQEDRRHRHRKVAYIREDEHQRHFYHFTASVSRSFLFGSQALHELCESIQTSGVTMDKENPYFEHFRV